MLPASRSDFETAFDKGRTLQLAQALGLEAAAGKGTEKVTVDDATAFLAKFGAGKNLAEGAYGTFEATRLAPPVFQGALNHAARWRAERP